MSDEETIEQVYGVIIGTRSAAYVGATLCLRHNGEDLLLNLDDPDMSDELRYALAQCYAKYKTPNHVYWAKSQRIIKAGGLAVPAYCRPSTRGDLLRKLQDGVTCETPTFGAEMTSIMLRGWLEFDHFATRPSENDGWTVFEPTA